MKERPIIFGAPMVRAILAGKKTQTRRIFFCDNAGPNGAGEIVYGRRGGGWCAWEGDVDADGWPLGVRLGEMDSQRIPCPYGKPGERLWVRERAKVTGWSHGAGQGSRITIVYEADASAANMPLPVRVKVPRVGSWLARGTFREASRIDLEITDVRCERLLSITEDDARAEGIRPFFERFECFSREQRITTGELAADAPYRSSFAVLWDEINGDRAHWKSNPWVWVLSFKRVRP